MRGAISVGQLSCFLTYANQYTKPFNEISSVITELQNALACARRVFDFIEEETETVDQKDAVVLSQVQGEVKLVDVSFSYQPEVPLLEHLNLTVKPGQKIAIVGPTGCGKTTLINLLMRFYDLDGGQILLDGNAVSKVTKDSLRASFGMVLQEILAEIWQYRRKYCIWKSGCDKRRGYCGSEGGACPWIYQTYAGRI